MTIQIIRHAEATAHAKLAHRQYQHATQGVLATAKLKLNQAMT
jgi:hypothetical protein